MERALLVLLAATALWVIAALAADAAVVLGLQSARVFYGLYGTFGLLFAFSCYGFASAVDSERFPLEMRRRGPLLLVSGVILAPLYYTDYWMTNLRILPDGSVTADHGVFFYVETSYILVVLTATVYRLFRAARTATAPREKRQALNLGVGASIGVALGFWTTLLLPILGDAHYYFVGPDAIMLFLILLCYSIVFHRLLDVRTAALRVLLWLATTILPSIAVLVLIVRESDPSLSQLFLLVLVALGVGLQIRFLQPRVDRFFFRERYVGQELLTRLIQDIQSLDEHLQPEERTLPRLLQQILDGLHQVLGFTDGFLFLADRFNRRYVHTIGLDPQALRDARSKVLVLLQRRVRLPPDFMREIGGIFLIEKGFPVPFQDSPGLSAKYPRVVGAVREFIRLVEADGYRMVIPLLFRREICGLLVIGERTNGHVYYAPDLQMLETARVSIAMALRNAILYEEILYLKRTAERRLTAYSGYMNGMEKVIRRKMKEKTLVYASEVMEHAFQKANEAAKRTQPILITGETGTGKELMASYIHDCSRAPEGPFVAVNCATVPRSLWESQVFGHKRGAFTDARSDHAGFVERAAGGTLFFDEIGEMPLDIQPKLLRLLQEKKFQKLGEERELRASCRFIFATNRDLKQLIKDGRFREDLFYRMGVFAVGLPPLRARRGDIPPLVEHLLAQYAQEFEKSINGIENAAMDALCRYPWPGNVRELENCIIQMVSATSTESILLDNVPAHIIETRRSIVSIEDPPMSASSQGDFGKRGFDEIVTEFSRELILATLKKCAGNKMKAAAQLGLKRGKFYYKLKELGIT